jgi:hypothetical protein
MTRFDDRSKRIREFPIAVMDEVSASLEEAPLVHGDISGHLLHPGFIGMWRDPSNLNATTLQTDEKKHVVRNQPTQGQYFHREKISARKDRQVHADEVCPSFRALTLLRRL